MSKTEKKIDLEGEIKKLTSELLLRLKIEAEVEVLKETPEHFRVNIKTEETGLIIGRHGETLNSLQLLLGVILYKKLGQWVRVILDVGDYRKAREESIKQMVERIITEVETSGQAVTLPQLTPLERRQVHLMLVDHPKATSESFGEGKERRVMIKPR